MNKNHSYNVPALPVIIEKYPNEGLPPIKFNTFNIGNLPKDSWQMLITQEEAKKWDSFFDNLACDSLPQNTAHHDIMYYPGMNSTAPYRNYCGPLTHFKIENYQPVPINQTLIISGTITEKYLKRDKAFTTFKLTTHTETGDLVQEHWRTFMLPAEQKDKDQFSEKISSQDQQNNDQSLGELESIQLLCSQERFKLIEGKGESTAHTDLEKAKQMGWKKTTAQACISIAQVNRLLTSHFGKKFLSHGFYDIKLIKPTFANETMNTSGTIVTSNPNATICNVKIETTENKLVTIGTGGIKIRD